LGRQYYDGHFRRQLDLMNYIFESWDTIEEQIKSSRSVFLLFDYDGTLTPIVEQPEMANLSNETVELLNSLSHKNGVSIAIISGRELADLRNKVNLRYLIYSGNHGFEIDGPGLKFIHPITEEIKSTLGILYLVLKKALSSIEGAFVENKGLSLSVHFRAVKNLEQERLVNRIFENTVYLARSLGKIKTTTGKKVLEIRPPLPWNKGQAVRMILKKYRKQGALSLYVGDDLTDEDAFCEIRQNGGIAIKIGNDNPDTKASYYLKDADDVKELLKRLNSVL
jgi:trehalose 6-phosphate phosphatase